MYGFALLLFVSLCKATPHQGDTGMPGMPLPFAFLCPALPKERGGMSCVRGEGYTISFLPSPALWRLQKSGPALEHEGASRVLGERSALLPTLCTRWGGLVSLGGAQTVGPSVPPLLPISLVCVSAARKEK